MIQILYTQLGFEVWILKYNRNLFSSSHMWIPFHVPNIVYLGYISQVMWISYLILLNGYLINSLVQFWFWLTKFSNICFDIQFFFENLKCLKSISSLNFKNINNFFKISKKCPPHRQSIISSTKLDIMRNEWKILYLLIKHQFQSIINQMSVVCNI